MKNVPGTVISALSGTVYHSSDGKQIGMMCLCLCVEKVVLWLGTCIIIPNMLTNWVLVRKSGFSNLLSGLEF